MTEFGSNVGVVYGVLTLGGPGSRSVGERAHFVILTAVKQTLLLCLEGCGDLQGGRQGLHGAQARFEPGASRWSQDRATRHQVKPQRTLLVGNREHNAVFIPVSSVIVLI